MTDWLTSMVGATTPAQPTTSVGAARRARSTAVGNDFASVLSGQLQSQQEVKFSAHAQARLATRDLALSESEQQGLRSAVDLAAAKGARQSLVLLNDLALIVNVPSRTVITAMGSAGAGGNVFTNIDSAVIAQGGDNQALTL